MFSFIASIDWGSIIENIFIWGVFIGFVVMIILVLIAAAHAPAGAFGPVDDYYDDPFDAGSEAYYEAEANDSDWGCS